MEALGRTKQRFPERSHFNLNDQFLLILRHSQSLCRPNPISVPTFALILKYAAIRSNGSSGVVHKYTTPFEQLSRALIFPFYFTNDSSEFMGILLERKELVNHVFSSRTKFIVFLKLYTISFYNIKFQYRFTKVHICTMK